MALGVSFSRSDRVLTLIVLKHVLPKGFDFVNVTSSAINGDTGEQEAFGEFAL